MDLLATLSTVLAALFGGVNIIQLVNNRQLKNKLAAEADQEQNKSLLQIINGQMAEIARLQQNYAELQDKYFAMAEEMQMLRAELAGIKNK